MGRGMYGVGVEPGNTGTLDGRSEARRLKMLTALAPDFARRCSTARRMEMTRQDLRGRANLRLA